MDEREGRFVLSYGTGDVPLQVTGESPYPMIARALVFNQIRDRLEVNEREVFIFDMVYLVSFTYITGNWTAVVCTTLPDTGYYVVTYDSFKEIALIEMYERTGEIEVSVPARRGKQ